ncbi:two-component system response regulator YesN [Mobilisporobacter senegalensis]|uniref:Stage 0 sporulation protein A homolog n=1 Tax=Mobilisporobacter senegalensis TaxID=1329262 RepID=A0A3N1XKF5_9FIRM|nr:response regulator [Mobilisporobacter senegalensis]ROR27205.1 two-component system response regulator YesN [Mobilisporobacter senegalensis]
MKTRVLLVDDEKLERVLIRKGYPWEENGFEIIGEASSGEEALEFFDIKEPDIVLTDINMPFMDGLVLTEKIRQRSEKCRVVIITGYREFDYARRACQLGVKDFILKPVNINEIATIIENIKEELKLEEGHHEEYKKLKETAAENQDIVIESFLQRLVENRIEEEVAKYKLSMYDFEDLQKRCICINISPLVKDKANEEETLEYSKKILQMIQDKYKQSVSFIHYLCNIILYLYGDEADHGYDIAKEIKDRINNEIKIDVDMGISLIENGFHGIAKAYRQSVKAISASVIIGRNCCITYKEYAEIKKDDGGKIDINWKDFEFNVENCLEAKVEEYINEYTNVIKNAGVTDTGYLKLMAMNMLSKAATVLTKHGKSLGQLVGEEYLYEEVSKIETVSEMNLCLKKIIKPILEYSDSMRTRKSNKLIDQALEYIEKHLYEQTLTLKTIAGKVFVNESYLSRIFKQEMGESLIEYITRKRIEQSIILLNTTDLKAYEIAEQIGISDPHYFSICFKKQVGVTIKEYKKPKF